MKFIIILLIVGLNYATRAHSQNISKIDSLQILQEKSYQFRYPQLILPSVFVGLGLIGLHNHWITQLNIDARNNLQEYVTHKYHIDDYSQYFSMASVYALNLCGVKGLHNLKERTILLASSYAIMGGCVNLIKYTTKIRRPDHSKYNSFPSGHTATAFMGAEFLRKEYSHISPWIGVGGYAIALGTGYLRMHNNRHWLTDVITAAGIGILSTKFAYFLYPKFKKLFKKKSHLSAFATPTFDGRHIGLSLNLTF